MLADENNGWAFEFTPYFLAAGMKGTAGGGGFKADVDVSCSDVWDAFDSGFSASGPYLGLGIAF